MSSYPIAKIEGIGPAYQEKLIAAGVTSTGQLLDACADVKGRKAMAEKTGIAEALILKWANKADLMRVKGVGEEFSDLLEAAGVDTVKELRTRKYENLHARMVEVNQARNAVRRLPTLQDVEGWVEFAKTLEPRVTH
jgi:predicted flap endonuclease-1-like 5' DNA nuclease